MYKGKVEWIYEASEEYVSVWQDKRKQLKDLEEEMGECYVKPVKGKFARGDRVKIGPYTFEYEEDNKFWMTNATKLASPQKYIKKISSVHEGEHVLTRYQKGKGERYIFENGELKESKEQELFKEE